MSLGGGVGMVHQTLMAATYSYTSGGSTSTSSHANANILIPVLVFAAIFIILTIIGAWKTFQKAGRPGWAAIIPVYNTWLLAEMADKPGWWGLYPLLSWIPFVGWIASLVVAILIGIGVAKNFGKDAVFGVVALGIFSPIGFLILGLSDAQYHGPAMGQGGSGGATPSGPTPGATPPSPPPSQPTPPTSPAPTPPTPPTNPMPPATPPTV